VTRTSTDRVVRDRMTLTLYGPFIVWGWLLYSFNPSVPLLARDLHISDTLAGLHGTAMAAGGLVAGVLIPHAVRVLGRRGAIVGACWVVIAGIVALVVGRSLWWTLPAMFVVALGGNALLATALVGLALHHGPRASAVITEANGIGSGVGLLGPLAVGVAVSIGWGWRAGVAVTAVCAVIASVLVWRLPDSPDLPRRLVVPGGARGGGARGGGVRGGWLRRGWLRGGGARGDWPHGDGRPAGDRAVAVPATPRWHRSAAALLFLGGVVVAEAVENATDFWSTALLIDRTGAGAGIAAAATAGLVGGMTAIRFVVGPLSLRFPPAWLLAAGFGFTIVGWAVFWTTTDTGVALAGLVLAGLGVGVQYPLSIAMLLAAAPGHSDRAQGDATLYGAVALGVAPFLLGWLSDQVGIHTAFLALPVFALVGVVVAVAGGWALRRTPGVD